MKASYLSVFILLLVAIACRESQRLPKPRAYPRIEYPERTAAFYDTAACPFTFEYPGYAEIKPKDDICWFDLYMPAFNARIHCSYIGIKSKEEFDDLVRDAFVIADRINTRANYMEEFPVRNTAGVGGLVMEWTGAAASPVHFFLTDTTRHFFKAALYYNAQVKPDSLAPVTTFIREDIDRMIETFRWKN